MDLKTALENVVWWEKEMEVNPSPGGGLLGSAMRGMEAAGQADPAGVWNILRNGTDDEFSALCNCLPEIAGEFDDEDNMRDIVMIAKQRLVNAHDPENIMAGIHGYIAPSLFDKFWNEPEPTSKARTFSQVI